MMDKFRSPCFVLDESKLETNLQLIQKVSEQSGAEIILAFKGFAMWSVFPLVKKYVQGATASSLHEMKLCNEFMEAKAHTYCVAYREEEMGEFVSGSSHLTFNSLNQLNSLGPKANENGVSIGLRINPEYSDVETELYNPSSPNSRLGVLSDELDELPDFVDGLHLHVLCESDSKALENTLESLEKRFGKFLNKIDWLNLGGGHLMTREGYDVDHLIGLIRSFSEKHDLKIILEPGSAFAWQAGGLHTRVLDVVRRNGVDTAIIDASFTCHMPDCLEMPYRPEIDEGSRDPDELRHKYRLGGVSCLAGDFLEAYSFDKKLEPGDSITFKDMMHYTMVKTSTFNGIQHPSIGILRKSGEFELVREFGYEDYRNRLS